MKKTFVLNKSLINTYDSKLLSQKKPYKVENDKFKRLKTCIRKYLLLIIKSGSKKNDFKESSNYFLDLKPQYYIKKEI